MRIKAYQNDFGGCYYYRLYLPFKALNKMIKSKFLAVVSNFISIHDLTGSFFFTRFEFLLKYLGNIAEKIFRYKPSYDLFILQRNSIEKNLKNMLFCQGKGAKYIYEVDDWLLNIDKTNPSHEYYMKPETQGIIIASLKYADAITVSTEYLKKMVSEFNSNVYVLPNCLNMDEWNGHFDIKKGFQNERNDGIVRIGYAGTATHARDYFMIKNVIPGILRMYPHTRIKFIGYNWMEIFKREFSGLENRIDYVGWQPIVDYPKGLYDVDIGIGPLFYNDFNRAKSNIKFLEYSAMGIPMVATDIEPYSEIENDVTGIKVRANNETQWIKALSKLIKNKTLRETIGENARAYVCAKYDIKDNWQKWLDVYEAVLKQPTKEMAV